MTDKKQTVLYKGMFYQVDDAKTVDVTKLSGGVTGSDIRQLDGTASKTAGYQEGGNMDAGGDLSSLVTRIIDGGYEAEADNTHTPGTVAWLKHELDAMEITYNANSRLSDLQQLFVDDQGESYGVTPGDLGSKTQTSADDDEE